VAAPCIGDIPRARALAPPRERPSGRLMATRILFLNEHETSVAENEAEVVAAVRRDHPNPVKLEGLDGLVLYVNWAQVTMIAPQQDPAVPA
jgi:hypothetical protein